LPRGGRFRFDRGVRTLYGGLFSVSISAKELGKVSKNTFYRYKQALPEGGVQALLEASRRKPNLKNRVEGSSEIAMASSGESIVAFTPNRVSRSDDERAAAREPSRWPLPTGSRAV
jgi:hypothetical protein